MPRFEVVVDELIVRGLDPIAARTVMAALESRLAELAAGADPRLVSAQDHALVRLDPVDLPAGEPSALGAAAGGAVWRVVGEGRRP